MSTGEIALFNEPRFLIRRVFLAATLGGGGTVYYLANLANYLELPWELRQLAGYDSQPRQFVGMFIASAVVCSLISIAAWWARQPGGAKVIWDDTAITEVDGGAIRTCIPWSTAQQQKVEVTERTKHGTRAGGVIVQISDSDGRRITVNGSSLSYPWMLTRRICAHVPLLELWNRATPLPPGKPFGPGAQSLVRPSLKLWSFLTFAASVAIAIGLLLLHREREAPIPIAAGALVLLITTALVPARELWRLRGAAGAQHLELTGQLDLSALEHPDALIHTRRGGAWVVKAKGVVTALETDDARRTRKMLARGVMLELALRLAVIAALVTLLVLQDLAYRRSRGY